MWSHCRIYNGAKFNEPENVFIDKMQSDRENSFAWLKIRSFSPSVCCCSLPMALFEIQCKIFGEFCQQCNEQTSNASKFTSKPHRHTHTTQRHQRLMPNCISLISLHRSSYSLFHSISHWLNAFFSFTSFNIEQLNLSFDCQITKLFVCAWFCARIFGWIPNFQYYIFGRALKSSNDETIENWKTIHNSAWTNKVKCNRMSTSFNLSVHFPRLLHKEFVSIVFWLHHILHSMLQP